MHRGFVGRLQMADSTSKLSELELYALQRRKHRIFLSPEIEDKSFEDSQRNLLARQQKILDEKTEFERGIIACDEQLRTLIDDRKRTAKKRDEALRQKECLESELEELLAANTSLRRIIEEGAARTGRESECILRCHQRITELLGMRVFPAKSLPGKACFQIEFTNIDVKNPQRKFLVNLQTDSNKTVAVPDTEPSIQLDDLRRAVDILNATDPHDFSSFFVWIRREFIKLV